MNTNLLYRIFYLTISLLVILNPLSVKANGTDFTQIWTARTDIASQDIITPKSFRIDADGNTYAAGYSYSTENNNFDFLTVKYNSNGNQIWAKTYDNGFYDVAYDIAVDNQGNAYVTGPSVSTDGIYGHLDYIIIKYDINGNQLWIARSEIGDWSNAITLDNFGNVYVTGRTMQGVITSVTAKYDSNGNQIWVSSLYDEGFTQGSETKTITSDLSGNIYVGGSIPGIDGYANYLVVKYNQNGNILWSAQYNSGVGYGGYITALTVDNSQNVYVTGSSHNGIDLDYATIKYSSEGNQQWVARYDGGGGAGDVPTALNLDNDRNVIVTGAVWTLNNVAQYIETIKYDNNGNMLWSSSYDYGIDEAGRDITIDDKNNIYIVDSSTHAYTNPWAVLIKYSPLGEFMGTIGYIGENTYLVSVKLDSEDKIYLAGGVGLGYTNSTSDIIVFKYSQALVLVPNTIYATADTYLRQGMPNHNEGSSNFLRIQASGRNRTLVQFDPQTIRDAVGTGILLSARLETDIQDNGNNWGSGRTIDIHRMTRSWIELGATWNCANDTNTSNSVPDCSGNSWNMNIGNAFVAAPTDTETITNNLSGTVTFDVTADIQAFLENAVQQYGWIIKKTNETQSGRLDFDAKETGNSPRLILEIQN